MQYNVVLSHFKPKDVQTSTYKFRYYHVGLFIEPFSVSTMGGSAPELHQIQRLSKLGTGPENDRECLGSRYVFSKRETSHISYCHSKQQIAPHLSKRNCLLQH